MSNRDGKIALK